MQKHASQKKRVRLAPIALLLLVAGCSDPPRIPLEEVSDFGTNPGELRMLKYVPGSLDPARSTQSAEKSNGQDRSPKIEGSPPSSIPLVVALHGCMQDAARYGEYSGWIRLADRFDFLLLLPEQRHGNNLIRCFNWYAPDDQRRDTGEALSIRQMIDQMRRDHAVDARRIYVTGVSAGAAMTLALMAVYPEIFAGGAPLAGVPFGCANGLYSGLSCMRHPPDKGAAEWGEAVRSATSHKGPWPRISVWQGGSDEAVDPANATAIVRQWTNVHSIDTTPDKEYDLTGHGHNLHQNSDREFPVESYWINGMGHGVPVDPGSGENQCGTSGKYFPDVGVCSSLYIARFWGLDH